MPRIPSKGLPTYLCLCASAALAALAFWLNPPETNQARSQPKVHTHSASPSTTTVIPVLIDRLSVLLRSTTEGDASSMHALEALADNPAFTIDDGRQLMLAFPDRAEEIGTILIGALVRRSRHAAAIGLAQSGPEASRAEWLQLVLCHWAGTEPDASHLIVDQLRQNAVSRATFELVAKNWAASEPGELARYALALPPGEHRAIALGAALEPWLQSDPSALAAALPQLSEPSERDIALAALAARTDTDFRPTAQALLWAESIADGELRRATLTHVIRDWFGREPDAASRYLLQQSAFDPDHRQSLLASLSPRPEAF